MTYQELNSMKRKELFTLARSKNITVYSNYSKARIIQAILNNSGTPLKPLSMSARPSRYSKEY